MLPFPLLYVISSSFYKIAIVWLSGLSLEALSAGQRQQTLIATTLFISSYVIRMLLTLQGTLLPVVLLPVR